MLSEQSVENVNQGLRALQDTPLSIIRLSEPFNVLSSQNRNSDASSSNSDSPTPASREADLNHYKELFSKLHFSYLEQVTKEKFLRAIVGDPPQIVEHAENVELEAELAEVKAVLKEQKQNVAQIVTELESRGRELTQRWETVQLQTARLSTLPDDIDGLRETLEQLRQQNGANENAVSDDPNLNLPLPATHELVKERKAELDEINKRLRNLQQALPKRTHALEREERELRVLEQERERAVAGAREALDRKKAGGGADELELRGRWLKGVDSGLRQMLGYALHTTITVRKNS